MAAKSIEERFETVESFIEFMNDHNFIIIDDHDKQEKSIAGVGIFESYGGELTPLALADARYYSTNELYLDKDGKVHLSKCAVGPTVIRAEGIQKANNSQPFGSGIRTADWADGNKEEFKLKKDDPAFSF